VAGPLGGVPVTTAWQVLGLRMEGRPPAMEGNCEYIEYDNGWSMAVGRGANNPYRKNDYYVSFTGTSD
jgi:hypothetical protein